MATVQKTTMKRFNGTDWDPIHLATSGDITQMGETFQVMGEPMGALNVGDTINATDSVTTIIKKMLQTRIAPSYTKPTASLTAGSQKGGNYEAGTSIDTLLTAAFTKNDAGDLTALKILKNGSTEVVTGASTPQTYQYTETLADGSTRFEASATYGDGEVKNDNLGDPSPTGQIKAGTVKSSAITFNGIRKYFYGYDTSGVTTAIDTSAGIRALTASSGAASKGTKFSISVPAGATRCTIAFDKTIGTLSQVLYRESGNANITSQFNLSEVNVEGANNYTAKAYNVYTISWAQPTAGAMTFDVTI